MCSVVQNHPRPRNGRCRARASIALAELSTGVFVVMELEAAQVADELARRRVRELLYPEVVSTSGGDGVPAGSHRVNQLRQRRQTIAGHLL